MVPKVPVEHKKKVEEKIIMSARKQFAKKGYALTSMDEIAKSANVSKGGLYHHFPSKEEIFQSVCKQTQQIAIKGASGLFRNKKSLESDLAESYDKDVLAIKGAPTFMIEAVAEAVHNPKLKRMLDQNRRKFLDIVTEILKQMRREGEFFQKKEDLRTIAAGMNALWVGLTVNKIVGTSHEENKNVWVKTVMAICFGSGT